MVGGAQLGTSRIMNVDAGASTGPLVGIVAPSTNVGGISMSGASVAFSGTSIAAPQVAGVAGLLFSFDPRLSAATVKQLILDGARNGGRTAIDANQRSYPFLDAYEALKSAAARPNAPLCGNRVYSTPNGDVMAERPGHPDEQLFQSIDGEPYTDLLNVLHGGKRIQIGDYLEFKWDTSFATASHWKSSTFDGNYHEDAGGAFLSWYDGTEHDGHTYVIVNGGSARLLPNDASGYSRLLPTQTFPATGQTNEVCTMAADNPETGTWDPFGCLDVNSPRPNALIATSGWSQSVRSTQAAFAPQGDFVLVGVNFRWSEQIIDPPSVPCTPRFPDGIVAPGHCATYHPARDSSSSVELWMIDTSGTKPWQQLNVSLSQTSVSGMNVAWVAVDETGTEMVWELVKDVYNGATRTCTNRVIEYRALPGHPTILAGGTVRAPIQLPDGCHGSFGPATFAPFRGMTTNSVPNARTLPPQQPRRRN